MRLINSKIIHISYTYIYFYRSSVNASQLSEIKLLKETNERREVEIRRMENSEIP